MRVLVLERNLLWSARLANSLKALGHEVTVADALPDPIEADVAIVNLAEPSSAVVGPLHGAGVKIIAHAGHKEKERLELGRAAGCDLVVTNSELTYKLPEIIAGLFSKA